MLRSIQSLLPLLATVFLVTPAYSKATPQEQIVALSAQKFKWLLDGDIDKYAALDPQSEMVHASGVVSDTQHDVDPGVPGA